MLGMSETQIRQVIENECLNFPRADTPEKILKRVAAGVAKVMVKNNAAIESELRRTGLKI